MKGKSRHGHRRTQSDRFSENLAPPPKLKIELNDIENDSPQIIKCLEESTRRNKTKTILIEDLELPKELSEQNQMFMFGRNHGWTKSTLINSHPSNEVLSKIPEAPQKRSKSYVNNKQNGFAEMKKAKKIDPIERHQGEKNRQGLHSENNRYRKDSTKNKINIESKHHAKKSHFQKNYSSNAKFPKKTKNLKNSDTHKSESFKMGHMHIASSYYFHFEKDQLHNSNKNGLKTVKQRAKGMKQKELKQNKLRAERDEKERRQKQKMLWNDIYGVGDEIENRKEGMQDWQKEFISQTIIKEGEQKRGKKRKKSICQKQKVRQKFREAKQIQNFQKKVKEDRPSKGNGNDKKYGIPKSSQKLGTKK